jgi:peptidoglycan/LPS O-acetylase OafA/YrhL
VIHSAAPVPERLPQLDALRAIAAVFVLLFHYDTAFGGLTLFQHSQLAVDFFFLLSGFVLSAGVERGCYDLVSGAGFIIERIGRLWPMMAAGSIIGLAATVFDGASFASGSTLLLALLFIPGRTPREAIFPLNGAQWSLLFELIANAAHALILWRLRTRMLLL